MHERLKMRRARQSKKPRTHVKPVVGTLVWIRRRNGSWWPGRIISTDELSSSHIMSQRSGTPVKLLGREDASVDWYNVEKSKRVKAFRCGEFDECIETAKALGGVSGKRREKYARREDAILDAIELEKKQLELMACFSETFAPDRNTKGPLKQEKLDAVVTSITSESSFDLVPVNEAGITFSKSVHHKQGRINAGGPDIDLEDEGTGSIPRMKGLHDLGMISGYHNTKKLESNVMLDGGCEGSVLSEACARPSPGNGTASHNSKNFSPWSKKKLTPNRCWEDGGLKRRDRRKPLTQVLESMTKLTMPVITNGKLVKCENLLVVQPKVRGTGCGPVAPAVADDTSSQEDAIKPKDELITENHKFGCLGPSKLEAGTAGLISTSACPVPLECTTVRRRKLSCLNSGDKDLSLISSSLSSHVSRPSTFVTSACMSTSAMECLSQHDDHFCKAMNGVRKHSSCFACSSSLGRGCGKPLSSKDANRLAFPRRIDGLNLMNATQPVHKALLYSDSSYTKLEGGQTLSSRCCSTDKSENFMEDEHLLSKSSQIKEQELLSTRKHQDATQLFQGVSEKMKNKIDEISNTYLVKRMRPPLNKCSTKCICCQDGPYSGVCKRPKLGLQSSLKGGTELGSYEESEPVLESLEHVEGQKKTWARGGHPFMAVNILLSYLWNTWSA
ncbi:hypothetical protein O6H91_10G075400 [Diphasiastrum complanatum]|uniref:Uncharacterized protein n=1 Tax=Diphasiastrum complanatum TaxID=34168 RepID=A0ACC2CIJ2_DIPCM|nr:hypothetical protein O6H91_10G075400 [Diphasiastrum complanatum]